MTKLKIINPPRIVGNFVRRQRERARLTQWQVARKLGYGTAQFVSNWERGVSVPPGKDLYRVARILGVAPEQMLEVVRRHERECFARRDRQIAKLLRVAK
jgi:transcriptional regulator with XRE-family HTH domain